MGLKDAIKKGMDTQREAETRKHYQAEVNKGSINVTAFERSLNMHWEAGWKLSHIFEQAGNTIIIWERFGIEAPPHQDEQAPVGG